MHATRPLQAVAFIHSATPADAADSGAAPLTRAAARQVRAPEAETAADDRPQQQVHAAGGEAGGLYQPGPQGHGAAVEHDENDSVVVHLHEQRAEREPAPAPTTTDSSRRLLTCQLSSPSWLIAHSAPRAKRVEVSRCPVVTPTASGADKQKAARSDNRTEGVRMDNGPSSSPGRYGTGAEGSEPVSRRGLPTHPVSH